MGFRFGPRTAATAAPRTESKEIPVGYHTVSFLAEVAKKSYESDLPVIGSEFRKFSAQVRKRITDLEVSIGTAKGILAAGKYPEVLHEGKLVQTDATMWQNAVDADTADMGVWAEIGQMTNDLRDNNHRLMIWRIENPERARANEEKYRQTKQSNAAAPAAEAAAE